VDAASESEWPAWLAAVVPTHFTVDDEQTLLVHLARPSRVWHLIEAPASGRARHGRRRRLHTEHCRAAPNDPGREGVPTSYYAQSSCAAEPDRRRSADKAELLCRQLLFLQPEQDHAPSTSTDRRAGDCCPASMGFASTSSTSWPSSSSPTTQQLRRLHTSQIGPV
jgi:hypothetical protein